MPVFPHEGAYTHISVEKQLSTDNWATLKELDVQDWPRKFVRLLNENTNGNSVDFRILGSFDQGSNYPVTLVSSTTLTAGSSNDNRIPEAVSHIKIEIQATTAGSQDEVSADIGLQNPAVATE